MAFDHAGTGFWFITDVAGDFRQLAWQSLEEGAEPVIVTGHIPWNVSGAEFSHDRKRGAFSVNVDGRLNHVDKIKVPMLVIQGQNDPRVPVTEAEQIVEALRAKGQPVWYMNALNEGHGFRKKENRDVQQQAMMMLVEKHLVGENP